MSFTPASGFNNFVPNDLIIPSNAEEMNLVLTDYFRYLINALNTREVAIFDEQEILTGQVWFNSSDRQKPRYGFRKVIDVGGLNDFTTTSPQNTAHGISINANFVLTNIYGTATDPNTNFIPLPYVDMSGAGANIQLSMDSTNVILDSNADYSAYTTAYVVLEYLKN
jgi:hypothetical protein